MFDVCRTDGGSASGFAQELAFGIKDNGALSVLPLKSNNLQAAGGRALAEGLKGNQVITELNTISNNLGCNSGHGADAPQGLLPLLMSPPVWGPFRCCL
jgi:hypothetical protein